MTMNKYEQLLVKFEARYKSLWQLSGFDNEIRAKQAKRAYLDLKKVVAPDRNLDRELTSKTFIKLAEEGDIAGIEYYRDSLIGNNVLSEAEVRCVNQVASVAIALAAQFAAIIAMNSINKMANDYADSARDNERPISP